MHASWLVLNYDLLEDRCIDDVIIKNFFLYILILYSIKQIDSKLPCICSVIDHRGRQNVVRPSVKHSAAPRVPLFCSYHILTSSVVYYRTDAWKLGIYLLSIFSILFFIHFLRWCKENLSNNPELSLLADPFLYPCDLNVWFRGDKQIGCQSLFEVKGLISVKNILHKILHLSSSITPLLTNCSMLGIVGQNSHMLNI